MVPDTRDDLVRERVAEVTKIFPIIRIPTDVLH